jgi:hypothetical protein
MADLDLRREASTQPGSMSLSRLVTIVNKALQPVRITAKQRLMSDGTARPLEALFLQSLDTRVRNRAVTVAGNDQKEYRLYLLVPTNDLPRNCGGVIDFQIDENEEPLRVNVQFP